jgi:hypothetical protein
MRGSLTPAFASARHVRLAVKLAYAFARPVPFPLVLSQPLYASVTLLEATSPAKLPIRHCLPAGFLCGEGMRVTDFKEWYSTDVVRLPPILDS